MTRFAWINKKDLNTHRQIESSCNIINEEHMPERLLLDCTLRDGGYINDWEFGHDRIIEIFQRLVSSGVDFIEIGFLDARRTFDINRTIMPDTQSADRIFEGMDKGRSIVLGMIDYGTCPIENLQPASESFIDGIRVIFKEHLMYKALEFCRQVKEKGYLVFAQMVSVTTYTDEKLKEYAELVNTVKPYATSMVDTYGLLDEEHLMHIFGELDRWLDPEVKVGFHAHNNFQLGFANARHFLGCDSARPLLADGTLYGMGKSAGNAPIELLMMYMNEKLGAHYDVSQVLEAIDNVIMDIYRRQYWGYNMFFYIAASTKCHPNYVSYLMNKKTLSVKQVTEILNGLVFEKKLMYDAKYAEQVYLEYQNMECDDRASLEALTKAFAGRPVLLVGPGRNIIRQKAKVRKFVEAHAPVVISVNYAPKDIKVDYIFLTNAKRYTRLYNDLQDGFNAEAQVIATSNVIKTAGRFNYILNYASLIDKDTEIIDNSLVMLLKVMMQTGVNKAFLAGFDGYSRRMDNYFDVNREYSFAKAKSSYLNDYVKRFLGSVSDRLSVEFITTSYYNK